MFSVLQKRDKIKEEEGKRKEWVEQERQKTLQRLRAFKEVKNRARFQGDAGPAHTKPRFGPQHTIVPRALRSDSWTQIQEEALRMARCDPPPPPNTVQPRPLHALQTCLLQAEAPLSSNPSLWMAPRDQAWLHSMLGTSPYP